MKEKFEQFKEHIFLSLRGPEKRSKVETAAAELAPKKVPGSLCSRKESGKGAWLFFWGSDSPRRRPRFNLLTRGQSRFKKYVLLLLSIFLIAWKPPVEHRNAKGNELYKKQNYEEALKVYQDAQSDAPQKPELNYNVGNALYQQKKYDPAKGSYQESVLASDSKLRANAYYNLASVQFRKGDLRDSLRLFEKALELNPKDKDTRYNIELIKKLLEKQPPPPPPPEEKKQEQQQQKQDQKQDKGGGGSQNQQDQQGQDQEKQKQGAGGKKQEEQQQEQGKQETKNKEQEEQQEQQEQENQQGQQQQEQQQSQQSQQAQGGQSAKQEQGDEQQAEGSIPPPDLRPEGTHNPPSADKSGGGTMSQQEADRILDALEEKPDEVGKLFRNYYPKSKEAPPGKDW